MIRVGIGGWTFEPWRGPFYPPGTRQADELSYASRAVTAIEINGTFYSTMKPASFRKWHEETPEDFIFSVKANRFCTNRKELSGARESIERFIGSGLEELGAKLGPVLWQFAPTKKFDPVDFEGFLKLLPAKLGKRKMRHVLEVRHPSFAAQDFVSLARKYNAAIVLADSDKYPLIADVTADFLYLRLQRSSAEHETGYAPGAIKQWAMRLKAWEKGDVASDMTTLLPPPAKEARDVFAFMIAGEKVRAPAAAMALLKELGLSPQR
jgi:uncharacterized protein YecE (DUF72 family)